MVATAHAMPPVTKRQFSSVFTPPAGYRGSAKGAEVTVEEILAGGINEDDFSFPVIVSTPSVDRVGDVVVPEGCSYKNFSNAPNVFFDHQSIRFAVGTMKSPHDGRVYFAVEPGRGIIGRVWINKRDNSDHGRVCKDVFYLVKDGLLNGISVGFEPRGQVKALRTGGSQYAEWEILEVSLVHIPANPDCVVIRDYIDQSNRVGKHLHPLVLKSLTAMSEATVAETVEKAAETTVEKAMSESSGTGGGYATSQQEDHPDNSAIEKVRKDIAARMEDHKHGEHGGTHEAFHHEESKAIHHVHGPDASPEYLKSVHDDLAEIGGVSQVHQSTEHPAEGSGYDSVYPPAGHDGNVHKDDMGGSTEEMSAKVAVKKAAEKAAKRLRRTAALVESGQHVQRLVKSGVFSWIVRKSLEDCVSHKIKYLHDSGEKEKHNWTDKQVEAIAYHYCGEKKGLIPPVAKGIEDYKKKEEDEEKPAAKPAASAAPETPPDATPDENSPEPSPDAAAALEDETHAQPMDEAAEMRKPGVMAFQTIIENVEKMIGGQEPEVAQFLEEIVQLARDRAMERYPDEDFGGEQQPDPNENRANDAEEQEQTSEDLARYRQQQRSVKPRRTKRYVASLRLKALRHPDHAGAIHKAANHCHSIGDMPAQEIEHKGHTGMFIKGYEAKHHAQHRIMGRALDRVHGAIAKAADEDHEDQKLTGEEHQGERAEGATDYDLDRVLPALKSYEQQRQAVDNKMASLVERAGVAKRA